MPHGGHEAAIPDADIACPRGRHAEKVPDGDGEGGRLPEGVVSAALLTSASERPSEAPKAVTLHGAVVATDVTVTGRKRKRAEVASTSFAAQKLDFPGGLAGTLSALRTP